MTSVLIVEDDAKIRANLVYQLGRLDLETEAVASAEEAVQHLQRDQPALLVLDVRLPGMSGVELVRSLTASGSLPPTIIVSGEASISETVEALRLGVHDFIEKPFSPERLAQSVRNTLDHAALRRQVAQLQSKLSGESELLGGSPLINALRRSIAQAAPTDAVVLIRGESGTGKELIANAIHRGSARREKPFIKLNCAAMAANLVEDELFGHARGAFTDARDDKRGLFEEAHGGTLFLDEIGDMEVGLQTRLLRVLEDGLVRRLGENRNRQVDVRVIAATHSDLERALEEGSFRQDLYFRLARLPIEVPPLRQRGKDIRLLFGHFIERYWHRHHMRPRRVDEAVFPVLEAYSWPGNVRELMALAERLVVFGADPITVDQIPARYRDAEPDPGGRPAGGAGAMLPLRDFKLRAERGYIEAALERTGGNVAAAARLLGTQRTYLHQRMNTLRVRRPTEA